MLGGWGQDEEGISPTLLSCTADLTRADRAAVEAEAAELAGEVEPCAYAWRRLQVAGAAPEGRAFHTTTEVTRTRTRTRTRTLTPNPNSREALPATDSLACLCTLTNGGCDIDCQNKLMQQECL